MRLAQRLCRTLGALATIAFFTGCASTVTRDFSFERTAAEHPAETEFRCAVDPTNERRRSCIAKVVQRVRSLRISGSDPLRRGEGIEFDVSVRSRDLLHGFDVLEAWTYMSREEREQPLLGIPVILRSTGGEGTLPEGVFRSGIITMVRKGTGAVLIRLAEPDLAFSNTNPAYLPLLGFRAWRDEASPLLRGFKATVSPIKGFQRAHVHLMEERTGTAVADVVLIHGLASNPEIWGPLLEAIYAHPGLRCCTRIWIVSYPSAPPVLVNRHRIYTALVEARTRHRIAEPWSGIVIGHSMGGVIARLLMVDPGFALTDVAFGGPLATLLATPSQREAVEALLAFQPVMTCGRLITLAAPFGGAPGASGWLGRFIESLQPEFVPELVPLREVARANEARVPEDLRASYLGGVLTSLTTLRAGQPVLSRASALRTPPCVTHRSIVGAGRSTRGVDGDGVVPSVSARHPQSSFVDELSSGHDIYQNADAIALMLGDIAQAVVDNSHPAARREEPRGGSIAEHLDASRSQ